MATKKNLKDYILIVNFGTDVLNDDGTIYRGWETKSGFVLRMDIVLIDEFSGMMITTLS